MSFNDLLEMEYLPVIILVFGVFVLIAVVFGAMKTDRSIYGDNDVSTEIKYQKAKVIAKRSAPYAGNQGILLNMVVFEFENGARIELAIKSPDLYGTMVEGDRGMLKYQGKKFISFERNI